MARKTSYIRSYQRSDRKSRDTLELRPAELFDFDGIDGIETGVQPDDRRIVSRLYRQFDGLGAIEQKSEVLIRHILTQKSLSKGAAAALLLAHPTRPELIVDAVVGLVDASFSQANCPLDDCPCRHVAGLYRYDASDSPNIWTSGSGFGGQKFAGHFCLKIKATHKPGYLLIWLPDGALPDARLESYLKLAATALSDILCYKFLRQERDMLLAILEQTGDCIEITDEEAVIEYVNPAFEQATGYTCDEAIGKTVAELLRPLDADLQIYDEMKRRLDTGRTWKGVLESMRKDRTKWIVETTLSPVFNDNGEICNHIAIKRDISEQVRLHDELRYNERRYRNLMDQAADAFFIHDLEGRFREVNQTACETTGYSRKELLGMRVGDIEQAFDSATLRRLWAELQREPVTLKGIHRRKDGSTFPVEVRLGVFDAVDEKLVLAMARNIFSRVVLEEQLVRQANYDFLTGLPNRFFGAQRLKSAVANAQQSGCTVAVMFIDLDGFKKVNDTLGHEVGDRLLQESAQRMQTCISAEDTVARLGGDEFMFVLPELENRDNIERTIQKILDINLAAYYLDGQELYLTASMGVAFYPGDGESPEILMRCADTAMYRSKKIGRNCCSFFSAYMSDSAHTALRMEAALRKGLEGNEFELHYQPIICNRTGVVSGVEALIRWNSPGLGVVSAEKIIRIAEETGLIVRLGEWVLENACQQVKGWVERFQFELSVAVNVSVHQLRHPNFVAMVESVLERTGWPAVCLQLEVTETALLDYSSAMLHVFNRLHDLGVKWAIDDFGTGYSSLSYVRNFPFGTLKVDRSFIQEIHSVSNDLKLVKAIVSMAKSFELDVVAEGVENTVQYKLLSSLGCQFIQGWYFSKALPGPSCLDYIHRNLKLNTGKSESRT